MTLSQNIEIEFKNMLTNQEYLQLKEYFGLKEDLFFTQENHYFDTEEFSLKDRSSALRIRQKDNHFEMTLKQPLTEGLLETNQLLTSEEAEAAFTSDRLPAGKIKVIIEDLGIPFGKLQYFGSLTTKRAEFTYENGLLVLDYSTYLNTEDYELEYEVDNFETGREAFTGLLDQFSIPERKTDNKIRRFYQQKYNTRK